jgi:hypothetical protein
VKASDHVVVLVVLIDDDDDDDDVDKSGRFDSDVK